MLIKSTAIQRLLRENPMLKDRRFGLPYVGARLDKEEFNPTVQEIADAIDFYGYEVRDANIVAKKDINLGDGNPLKYEPFQPSIDEMIKSLKSGEMYKYPYTEGDDNIRRKLLEYIDRTFIDLDKNIIRCRIYSLFPPEQIDGQPLFNGYG
jgi:hypothetical protein